ncbi:Cyclic pyranopterin monophosphate synthase [Streptomyces sp. YIM 130001]|uniref:radical SAM protein n=1 Tax=Streptomyces sp. YIM 130001 TaxID=2259644 RepID=UPI000ED6FAA6|nr:radical SAM protein [Streptomyces sp. YIM 130001]RII13352.1 Cyclic pyranopterin monophosphate synthase [Streptomyces sp. YIM 130001]
MTASTAPAHTDWTALRNFAALRGQQRVSLTPVCNIGCWFCHNESDTPPALTRNTPGLEHRARTLTADDLLTTINALRQAGLKRVYFTGGEPLTSPLARDVLTGLTPAGADGSYTLITNGTRVRTHRSWLAQAPLDKIKVSLHYFSDDSFRAIAGTRLPISRVLDGIETARELFERVELNCLLQKENAHEVRRILDYALERRMPVQFIELVGTDFNADRASSALAADDIVSHLRTLTREEHVEIAGVGQGRRVFRIDGVEVDVIHRDLGRHHVGQCGPCPLRKQCVEGFWALRVDHGGGVQPCLLRDDLRLDVQDLLNEPDKLAAAVADHVTGFTEGTL